MSRVHRVSSTVLCVFFSAQTVIPTPPEHSISISRQFLVYGSDVRFRGAVCDLAEGAKRDLLQLLDQRDAWATPIVINLQYPQANSPDLPRTALNFAQTGFGLKFQLDLTVDLAVSEQEMRRELLRALLLEMMYRREIDLPAGTAYVTPPAWLLEGIPRRQLDFDRAELIDALGVLATSRKILPLKEFLQISKLSDLDAPSRFLFRAYSFALVELLTELSDGRGRLARFIADLPVGSDDPMLDLRLHFPELSNANNAEKAWALQIERLASTQPFQLLSAEATKEKLDQLLVLRISAAGMGKKYYLEEFPLFIRDPSSKLNLSRFNRDLSVLAMRANPIWWRVIHEYAEIGALLARRKTNGIRERLTSLKVSQKRITVQMRKINDYLNWFEAMKPRASSGTFTDYLKQAEIGAATQRRRDRISVYLDALEMQVED